LPVALAWTVLGVLVILLDAPGGSDFAEPVLTVMALVWGAVLFWTAGGRFMTAASIFGLGVALFIGGAGLLTLRTAPDQSLVPVLSISFFSAVWASVFFGSAAPQPAPRPGQLPGRDLRFALIGAASAFLLAVLPALPTQMQVLPTIPPQIQGPFLFGTTVLAANALFFAGHRLPAVIAGLAGMLLYVTAIWDGFGRLELGALGLALAAAAAPWFPARWVKAAILLALAPTLLLMAASRESLVQDLNPYGLNENAGTGSIAAPVSTGSRVIELIDSGVVAAANGSTYVASAVAAVPRSLWPDKPIGWGKEITLYTRPELATTIHSEAATGFVEPYWNFRVLGIFMIVPLIGLGVRAIDALLRRPHRLRPTLGTVLVGTCGLLLASSLPDFIWGGSFTFVTRGGFRTGLLLVFVLPFAVLLALMGRADHASTRERSRISEGAARDRRSSAITEG
jgi:hypothetical protein